MLYKEKAMPCEFDVTLLEKKGHVKWVLDHADRLQCHLTYEPLTEDANKELITVVAQAIGIPKSKVRIVHGRERYEKKIKITDHDITFEQVLKALGIIKA